MCTASTNVSDVAASLGLLALFFVGVLIVAGTSGPLGTLLAIVWLVFAVYVGNR